MRKGKRSIPEERSVQRSWGWKEYGELDKLREGLCGCTGNEGVSVRQAGSRPRRAWKTVVQRWLLSYEQWEALDERHNVIRFAFEKIPSDPLIIANNGDMTMMMINACICIVKGLFKVFSHPPAQSQLPESINKSCPT